MNGCDRDHVIVSVGFGSGCGCGCDCDSLILTSRDYCWRRRRRKIIDKKWWTSTFEKEVNWNSATHLDLERLRLFGDLDLDLERPPRDLLRERALRERLDERRRRERDRLRLRLERLDERDLPPRPDTKTNGSIQCKLNSSLKSFFFLWIKLTTTSTTAIFNQANATSVQFGIVELFNSGFHVGQRCELNHTSGSTIAEEKKKTDYKFGFVVILHWNFKNL